ncbi:hypothetical protein [Maribacter aestuarii]|uniref:hypothetical protein n=1 Tax=Maribacter aestuarii TaxID=1130723 RepID=UPI0025A600A6|nr:hypothetical protein [Maribacter aestuarii]
MKVNKVLDIKDYGAVDLNNPREALDYFIYLTGDEFRLASLTLHFSLDNYSLSTYNEEYLEKEDYFMKYMLPFHFGGQFYDTFISTKEVFIFNKYFFENSSSTDIEKKSKLNTTINNIKKLLDIISKTTKRNDFSYKEIEEQKLIAREFEIEFTNKMVCHEYTDDKTIVIKSYPYKLLLFCLGVDLKRILEKIYIDFAAFIVSQSFEDIETKVISKTNPFPRIFKDYNSYVLFDNLKDNICTTQRTELADYSFVFRILQRDKYLYENVQEREFREFIFSNYQVNLEKLKTLNNCSPQKKIDLYNLTRQQSEPR